MDVIARYFDMWNTGDTAIADQVLHPGWVDHAHPEVTGPDSVKQAVHAVRSARPNLRFTIHSVLGDDDLVAVVGSVGQAPQTAGAPGRLVWLVRLADGLMAEMWTYQQSQVP
ncbi:nuclear transport factor 2 family protein [Actinoplanes sp. NPDC026623]|uniref:ester cyclase n=1 Tax=Actinoplanes sp. NPDC026623 TaxID=3155610 RepID=UPI0034085187